MKLLFTNPKYWPALLQDTIGQEDKAKATLGIVSLEDKRNFWYTTAVFCAAVGIGGAFFTYGASLLLLLVSARKWQLIKTKKEATPPVQPMGLLMDPGTGETAMDAAVSNTMGKKTLKEKMKWQMQNLGIQVRTRKLLLPLSVAFAVVVAGIVGAAHLTRHQATAVAPKQLCECPVKQEPPVQGKAKAKTEKK